MPNLKFYNTLTAGIEEFTPQNPREVSMFVCGPTVYGLMHLGHARTYIFFDLVYRLLTHLGYKVHYVQNITDVGHLTDDADQGEDKILRRAMEEGKDPKELADFFFGTHRADMAAIGNLEPDYRRATDYIPQIIKFIQGLIEKGFAYESGGNVYFSLDKFPQYGELSGRNREELIAGMRVEQDPRKKNPADFALWLKAPEAYPYCWTSPWGGKGFPGWHIEDSTIIKEVFGGRTIDIHGGANELVFPHHENEIAQFEALLDEKQARYWLHTGLVLINGEKMSKSKGNFITVQDALERQPKQVIRLWVLKTHFRSPLDYNEDDLHQTNELWKKILRFIFIAQDGGKVIGEYQEKFEADLLDNFNTPKLLTDLYEMLNNESLPPADVKATLLKLDDLLGLGLANVNTAIPKEILALLERRESERKKGNFDFADTIRSELLEKGWQVDDTPDGPMAYPL